MPPDDLGTSRVDPSRPRLSAVTIAAPAQTGSPPALKILILEDEPTDAELMQRELRQAGLEFTARRVDTRVGFVEALETFAPDIVLADYKLPDFSGAEALAHVRCVRPEVPVVIVTGQLGDEAAIELLHGGARDYVLKSNLLRLPSSVERAIAVEQGIRARKSAEAALRESNTMLQTTERLAHIGGFDWDIVSGRLLWSEETYRMFGLAPGEFVPSVSRFIGCIYPDDRRRVQEAIDASVTRNAPYNVEFHIQRPDKAERVIRARGEIISDENGQPVRITGTSQDVTEQKHAERQIVEDEAKFRSLVEQNVAGIFIIRDDGTIGYVNPFFAGVLGYAAADLIGRPLLDILSEDEKPAVREKLEAQLAGDAEFVQHNLTMPARDGRPIDLMVNASRSIFEGRPASLAVVLDITETNKAQRALASTAAILATEHEVSPDGIVVVDPQRSIISANRRFVDMWGIPAELMATKSEEQAFAWALQNKIADPVAVAPQMEDALAHPDKRGRYEVTLRDGRVYEVHRSPMTQPDGGYLGRVWFFRDITDRKQAEEDLRTSEERFRLLVEQAPDAILLYDVDRDRFIAANKAAAELFGCDRDELLKHGPQHFYPPEQPDSLPIPRSFVEHVDRALTGEEITFERRICNALGQERLCQVTLVRLPSAGLRLCRASFVDITDQRAAEQTLRRLNRTLRTLSRGNEALVRAASEPELLRAMCRVIVETGGYRMAWVGIAEPDAAKTVTPVAWAGEVGNYLGKAQITWADEPRGRGPTGRAIRSGEPQVSQNVSADQLMTPWQEEARQNGFASTIALPLKDQSGVFAALTIYSTEIHAFDGEETDLLQELANDLAYGVRSLRERAAREALEKRWRASLEATVGAIANTVELRDPYTAGHQLRTAKIAVAMARELALPEQQIQGLYLAGIIHDVGKIDVPAEILSKPSTLSELQYQLIQMHAEAGYDIIKGVDFPWPIAEIVRQHHERIDGSGYPRGLTAEAILPEAKILAVADVVEAMMSHRPYRASLGIEAALAEIENGKGQIYDPPAVDACVTLLRHNADAFL